MTDEAESVKYRVSVELEEKKASTISRADVADFLIKQSDCNCEGREAYPKVYPLGNPLGLAVGIATYIKHL